MECDRRADEDPLAACTLFVLAEQGDKAISCHA